ncbi:hypothetical protein BDN70DRAFT_362412 [Pholiota conissans]|uniref:Uncharacterized protein n=1 Tax=Pholiota conissans TaxID=109636 RepID=A0A9P5YPW8_9AGAR|nr:hypothetical protein BDN70DRAFT_362412 [Pholiota conissans]
MWVCASRPLRSSKLAIYVTFNNNASSSSKSPITVLALSIYLSITCTALLLPRWSTSTSTGPVRRNPSRRARQAMASNITSLAVVRVQAQERTGKDGSRPQGGRSHDRCVDIGLHPPLALIPHLIVFSSTAVYPRLHFAHLVRPSDPICSTFTCQCFKFSNPTELLPAVHLTRHFECAPSNLLWSTAFGAAALSLPLTSQTTSSSQLSSAPL